MPIITYRQGGTADPEVFEFEFDDLLYPECVAIERATGKACPEEVRPVALAGNTEVRGALLAAMLKRSEPTLKAEHFLSTFRPSEMVFEMTAKDAAWMLNAIHEIPADAISSDERDAAIAAIKAKTNVPEAIADEDAEVPKA